MAATLANGSEAPPMGAEADVESPQVLDDPFTSGHFSQNPHPHRFSAFDTQLFSLNATSSPGQVKRTLEAHIAETDRRLGDASKLGTTLLEQRRELQDKLQEIENKRDDAELSPELRQRLLELEKEYNEVGRDSARAILAPRSRVVSAEERPVSDSPAYFSGQASASPTKVTAPSRKQRNQTSSRVGDIQFAADISTSLLAQVRQLQGVLAERDDALKAMTLEKSRLELEAEGFNQRLRSLDESEQRYKDENWNLETQTHELIASAKESAEREKKLNATLAATLAEKTRSQNELDELRLAHGKLADDHSAAQKAHDSELHAIRRTVDTGESERSSLQNRIEELTSQNQELAKAVASRFRGKETGEMDDYGVDTEDYSRDFSTPETSPPPSPTKATPRHPGLESETLKSSLHHAHRMIQNLKGNIHREKTEKIELKRMLQEARDELETRRGESVGPGSGNKRQKTKSDIFKKSVGPSMLGANRRDQTDIELEDSEWQDHNGEASPSQAAASRHLHPGAFPSSAPATDLSDAYQTANDTDGFDTANERGTATESDAFQTGAESLAGDSTDELTETEGNIARGGTIRGNRPAPSANRMSFQSTASTSNEEGEEHETPIQPQPKYRLKLNKLLNPRRSRNSMGADSAQSSTKNSPASGLQKSPPVPGGQSLFAELNEADDGEFGTPARSSVTSARSPPSVAQSAHRSVTMSPQAEAKASSTTIDSGMMTEPWQPSPVEKQAAEIPERNSGTFWVPSTRSSMAPETNASDFPLPPSHPGSPGVIDSSTQWTPHKTLNESPSRNIPSFITPPKTVWDEQQDNETPVRSAIPFGMAKMATQETQPLESPSSAPVPAPVSDSPSLLAFSGIAAQQTTPIEHVSPAPAEDKTPSNATEGGIVAAAGAGVLGSVRAALGFRRQSGTNVSTMTQNDNNRPATSAESTKSPLQDISGNSRMMPEDKQISMNDQGAQTLLTSAQIDKALMQRVRTPTSPLSTTAPLSADALETQERKRNENEIAAAQKLPPVNGTPRRPSSSNSARQSLNSSHPPLPPDHKEAIVAAGGKLPLEVKTDRQIMGPPIAPASAYKRPRTPAEQVAQSPSRTGTTPRARARSGATSQLSRRSSVSSFASELDERFNINAAGLPTHHAFEPGTDPRMIQAITQTMIGEFLWKYTRKAGRGDMSNSRHRRYFWVHPYTRTLYWSDQDPQSAGRSELKAKSVAIEAVRVVTDDNPMPPGLHRKSLEVITPGRKLKFTAATSQRHETWFNALSYLLLRNPDEGNANGASTDPNNLTSEDVDEFNPGAYNRPFSHGAASRASLSSYNSRTTQNTAIRTSSRLSNRQSAQNAETSTASRHLSGSTNQDSFRKGSISRFSNMIRGSIGYGRRTLDPAQTGTGEEGSNSIYNASLVEDRHDSAEDLRKKMLQQEKEADRLENVRACCDGESANIHTSWP